MRETKKPKPSYILKKKHIFMNARLTTITYKTVVAMYESSLWSNTIIIK